MEGSPSSSNAQNETTPFTPSEIARLKQILLNSSNHHHHHPHSLAETASMDSDYPEFTDSTHAWAVFADNPQKRAGGLERAVGTVVILFQLFTYWLFASEAIEDYQAGQVVVKTAHADCLAADEEPQGNFTCEAEVTNQLDAFVAFFMLGVFLTSDFLQAFRVIRDAPNGSPLVFASLAGIEVVCAYLAACIAISYNLYIGEVTDAVEVGVGLLFIRELSQRAYAGIRYGKTKQYKVFFGVLTSLVVIGMVLDPVWERKFAAKS
eukprot:CAMPEP_0119018520 /NCGR_PEP_ID=MMETSP1176-20130426/19602_1 /TAXON_ID=265551 /ORGANISM="Synedropsis recta cf, Strain CCMP1620" /LENGTH=263 /DNA_ID=CAMNT_0006972543 /DNA_START=85 /DNA_END=876 /DNA_ORIENTATION=+